MKSFYCFLFFFLFTFLINAQTTKVLFIGNSLTGWYDQPVMFEELCAEAGLDVKSVNSLHYGTDISFHITNVISLANISFENWDYVVLQGNRYEIAFSDKHHILYPTFIKLKEIIEKNHYNTKIIFFMNWLHQNGITWGNVPYTKNEFHQLIKEGTMLFADSLNFIVSPIGEAFNYVMNNHEEINLIDSDNIHQSREGSYLTACVYFYLIFGKELDDHLSYRNEVEKETAEILQDVAEEIVIGNYDYWFSTLDTTSTETSMLPSLNNSIDLQLFPNPVTNILHGDSKNVSSTYRIYNLIGKKLAEGEIDIENQPFYLDLSNGIYLFSFETGEKLITKRFEVLK